MKDINHHIIDYKTIQANKKFDIQLVRQVLPFYFEEDGLEIARLYGGFRNTSAYVSNGDTSYVLRIYTNAKKIYKYGKNLGKIIKAEWSFIEYLGGNDIPVPYLVPNREGELVSRYKDKYIVLMNYIDGKDCRYDLNNKKFENLGTLMAKMHRCSQEYPEEKAQVFATKDPLEYIKEKIKPDPPDLYDSFLEVNSTYEKKLPMIKTLPKYLIHGDLIFSNILFSGNKIEGILDFDDLHRGVFVKELAKFIISVYDHHRLYDVSLKYVDCFMQSYIRTRALSQHEKVLLPLYLDISRLSIRRMLKKYRPELLEQYMAETKEAIYLVSDKYL